MVWECRALLLCRCCVFVVRALLLVVFVCLFACVLIVRVVCCLCVVVFVGVVWPPQTCVFEGAVCCCVAAVSYSPTPSQVQYHRRCGA